MENEGSISMYFEATNRLQPLALPQHHHLTTLHHRILTENLIHVRRAWSSTEYGDSIRAIFFGDKKSITTIEFTPKPPFHTFLNTRT